MKAYYEDSAVKIYHGDCREILPTLPRVDLVLTDPPYGVGINYGVFDDTPRNVRRLVADVIPVCIEKSERTALSCATRQIHFYPEPSWILCWLNRAGSYANPWGFTCWQPILVYGSDPYLQNRMGSRADVIEHSETALNLGHPCPKPENFWRKLLARCSVRDSDTVLDPFMGSGTTLRAAKDLGRKAIGIEIEERYCEIAARRMEQEVLPLNAVQESAVEEELALAI
jgi:site-specific DNA-methyltransferase (adenine-specific)